jgi:hypothetical protein
VAALLGGEEKEVGVVRIDAAGGVEKIGRIRGVLLGFVQIVGEERGIAGLALPERVLGRLDIRRALIAPEIEGQGTSFSLLFS